MAARSTVQKSIKNRRDAMAALAEAIERVDRIMPQGKLYDRALCVRASLELSGFAIRRLPARRVRG